MIRSFLPLIAMALVPLAVTAQSPPTDPVSESIRTMYGPVKASIIAAAEQMPEEHYDFRPTPEVRSFGELIGHIAFAQFNICSGLSAEENPRPGNLEQTLSAKVDLVQAIQAAFELCDTAYDGATDAQLGETVNFFGSEAVRHYPMTYGLVHANEHYGNIVTYMRMKGLVPPSSQGS